MTKIWPTLSYPFLTNLIHGCLQNASFIAVSLSPWFVKWCLQTFDVAILYTEAAWHFLRQCWIPHDWVVLKMSSKILQDNFGRIGELKHQATLILQWVLGGGVLWTHRVLKNSENSTTVRTFWNWVFTTYNYLYCIWVTCPDFYFPHLSWKWHRMAFKKMSGARIKQHQMLKGTVSPD